MSISLVNNAIINTVGEAMKDLGKKIKKEREDWGYSQMYMAQNIPMNQSNYSKIERDIQEPNIDQLKRICEILKLDANYLLETDNYKDISYNDTELLNDVKILITKHKNSV